MSLSLYVTSEWMRVVLFVVACLIARLLQKFDVGFHLVCGVVARLERLLYGTNSRVL